MELMLRNLFANTLFSASNVAENCNLKWIAVSVVGPWCLHYFRLFQCFLDTGKFSLGGIEDISNKVGERYGELFLFV